MNPIGVKPAFSGIIIDFRNDNDKNRYEEAKNNGALGGTFEASYSMGRRTYTELNTGLADDPERDMAIQREVADTLRARNLKVKVVDDRTGKKLY